MALIKIRQCCCALHTFVRIVSILLLLLHVVVAAAAVVWYALMDSVDFGADRDNSIPRSAFDVVFAVLLVFNAIGILANVLVMLGIKLNKRSLLLPWLVFQLMVILGCFAAGVYIGLHFTILSIASEDEEDGGAHPAYAVLCLFPIVAGIFLIFIWILFDQLFIQMRTIKSLGLKAVSSSNLSQLRSNVATATAASVAGSTITYHNDTVRSVKSVMAISTPAMSVSGRIPRHHVHGTTPVSVPRSAAMGGKRSTPSSVKRRNKVARRDSAKRILAYNSQSLPRPKTTRQHHKVRELNYQFNLDSALNMKRAKSLEQMLHNDSSESSSASTGATTMTTKSTRSTGSSSTAHAHTAPNVWVASPGPNGQRGGRGHGHGHPASRASSMNGSRQRHHLHHQKDLMSSSAESEQYERLSSVSSPNQQRLLHPAAARPVLSRSTSYGAHDKMFASAAASAAGITTAGLSAAPTPSYCTIDRSRLRRGMRPLDVNSNVLLHNSSSSHSSSSSSNHPQHHLNHHRLQKGNMQPIQRTPSLQLAPATAMHYKQVETAENRTLVHVGGNAEHNSRVGGPRGPSYIGDLGGLDDLRRATDDRLLGPAGPNGHAGSSHAVVNGAKSVTIHPDVTEFRYPGENSGEHDYDMAHPSFGMSPPSPHPSPAATPPPPPPPPPPPTIHPSSAWVPQPVYPSALPPPPPRQDSNLSVRGNSNTNGLPVGINGNSAETAAAAAAANSAGWLSKLSPSKPPSYTKNQIIDFYCQAGDVQL